MDQAKIHLMLFDGRRQLLPDDAEVLIRLTNGAQEPFVVSRNGPVHDLIVPFTDGPKDTYTVYAAATGYVGAGYNPVTVNPAIINTVSLMLLPHDGSFNFADAQFDKLAPNLQTFLASGAANATAAQTRYDDLLEKSGPSLACLFNIVTAMADMEFNPFAMFRQLVWDGKAAPAPAKDRFFAYADRNALIDKLQAAVTLGTFEKESKLDLKLHPGATSSYKQIQFGEGNVQFTLHENDDTPKGKDWVLVEPDIDFFRDVLGHFFIEVIPGFFSKTDPKGVYVLRWIAAKQARIQEFRPPFVVV
jgi:hypothetical protein